MPTDALSVRLEIRGLLVGIDPKWLDNWQRRNPAFRAALDPGPMWPAGRKRKAPNPTVAPELLHLGGEHGGGRGRNI